MKKLLAIPAILFAFALGAQAQDTTAPTLTFDTPENGVVVESDRVTINGMVSDDVGVVRVEFRLEGQRRWRRAIMTAPGEASSAFVTSYKNRNKKKRRRGIRVYLRAIDAAGNESDITGRRIRQT